MHLRQRTTHFLKTKSNPSFARGLHTASTTCASCVARLSLQGIARSHRVRDQVNTGLRNKLDAFRGQEIKYCTSDMRASIVLIKKHVRNALLRAFFCENVHKLLQDLKINVLRDCYLLRKRILVNESRVFEENDHHNLPSTSSWLCFHRRRRLATFPLRTLLLCLWIIIMHPEFIYRYDAKNQVLPSQNTLEVCDKHPLDATFDHVLDDGESISNTHTHHLQVVL